MACINQNMKKTIAICDSCGICEKELNRNIKCGSVAFNENTSTVVNILNECVIETTAHSYAQFLQTSNKYEMKISDLIHHQLLGLSNTGFDIDIYFKLDRLFLQWTSWYKRVISFFRLLLLNEIECPHVIDIITQSIIDYYNSASGENYFLPFKDDVLIYFIKYSQTCLPPKSNGDFSLAVQYIGEGVLNYFQLIILQYAQNYIIDNKINRLYYNPTLFKEVSNELENIILTTRINQIKEYANTVHVWFTRPPMEYETKRYYELENNLMKPNFRNVIPHFRGE